MKIPQIVKYIVSVVLLCVLIVKIDIFYLFEIVSQASFIYLLVVFLVSFTAFVVQAKRLNIILSTQNKTVTLSSTLRLNLSSLFYGLFLPTNVGGDIVKATFIYSRFKKITKTFSLSAVIFDRFIGLFALLIMLMPLLLIGSNYIPQSIYETTSILTVILFSLSAIALLTFPQITMQIKKFSTFKKVFAFLDEKTFTKKQIISMTMYSIIFYLLQSVASCIVSYSFGVSLPVIVFFIFVPLLALVSTIPLSINGLGFREGFALIYFTSFGLSQEQAVLFSLIPYTIKTIFALLGGLDILINSQLKSKNEKN